ncbi:cardiolipin synthase [Oenococcus sp. UCMA 14587]|nr:cardiolipin synthase [Oenococcus sp. UCMA 14587]MDN6967690.1 cardiolipin synthase [Oenococcus sp. UCMA 17063]
MNLFIDIILIVLVLNATLAFITVFWSKRDVSRIWAWLIVLIFVPIIGFIIYWFAGRRISDKKIFDFTSQEIVGREQIRDNQKYYGHHLHLNQKSNMLVELFENNSGSMLTYGNDLETFFDGQKFFDDLFAEIEKAKDHIHLAYFAIGNDLIGNQLVDLLTKKAHQGVEVRVIYDAYGSHGTHLGMYRRLLKAGGVVYPFLTRRFQLLALRINFRFHRKVVVIDGKVGYIGGFNIGDQYLGKSKRFGNWRDSQLKIIGDSVLSLQSRFFIDWNATAKNRDKLSFLNDYFPATQVNGIHPIQIVSSGPDSLIAQIKQGYLKMITLATKSITIQTPYLIPDQPIYESLMIALAAGVKVNIFIPDRPDHPFVYRATQYYAQEFIDFGANVYRYDGGFLHSKLLIIDDEIVSIGSANMDIRSFELSFEANAFIYSSNFAKKIEKQISIDISKSKLLSKKDFEAQGFWMTVLQKFSRLLSPIL